MAAKKTGKKSVNSYEGKTLEQSLFDILESVYEKNKDIIFAALTIKDKSDNVLYKESNRSKSKICYIERDSTKREIFNSEVSRIILVKHRSALETDSVHIVSVDTVIKVTKNKNEKYAAVTIIVDGYPTLEEAIRSIVGNGMNRKFELLISNRPICTNSETYTTTHVRYEFTVTDSDAFLKTLNPELLATRLTWAPRYHDDTVIFRMAF